MILVTGAGGTVGTALIEGLSATGHRPRLAYHSPEKARRAARDGYDAVTIELAEPGTLRPALEGVETVFLLGAGGRGQSEREINAARASQVKRLVKLSVWDAPREQFALARIHRTVERAVETSGLAWTFLRPNGFMQNFVSYMAGSIKSQNGIFQPAGDAKISHVDVRDVARVAARVLTTPGHEGKAYALSGPQALTYGEAAEVLSRVLGGPITYVALSDEAARAGMLSAGVPDFYADYLLDLFRVYRTGAASQTTPDVKNITGREPVSFEQFVCDSAEAFR